MIPSQTLRLAALLLVACAGPVTSPPEGPPGSRITCGYSSFYYEHQTADGGWERVSLVLPDGGVPITRTVMDWATMPTDAGPVRVRFVQ